MNVQKSSLFRVVFWMLFFGGGLVRCAWAQTATSESYLLEIGELLEEPESVVAAPRHLRTLYSGFPNATANTAALQLTIDKLSVDFGAVFPGQLEKRTSELLINSTESSDNSINDLSSAIISSEYTLSTI